MRAENLRSEEVKEPSKTRFIIFMVIVSVVLLSIIIIYFLFHPVFVVGSSMEPTLKSGQLIRTTVKFGKDDLKYDSIIVFKKDGQTLIKRIVGLPNDTVEVKEDGVYVNGKRRDERKTTKVAGPVILAEDEYYVLGDNRDHSYDSRDFGPICFKNIRNLRR